MADKYLTDLCGHHCGIKDGIAGHCNCGDCHDGVLPQDTVQMSTKGMVLPKGGVKDA